jgi:hypothetical protein
MVSGNALTDTPRGASLICAFQSNQVDNKINHLTARGLTQALECLLASVKP